MSTKSEKVWVIVREPIGAIYGTTAKTEALCISKFISGDEDMRPALQYWEALRAVGYRCVRATLTWEEPDE